MVPAAHMASNPVIGILLATLPPLAFALAPPFPPPRSSHLFNNADMKNMTFSQLKDLDAVWTQMVVSAVEKSSKKNHKSYKK